MCYMVKMWLTNAHILFYLLCIIGKNCNYFFTNREVVRPRPKKKNFRPDSFSNLELLYLMYCQFKNLIWNERRCPLTVIVAKNIFTQSDTGKDYLLY